MFVPFHPTRKTGGVTLTLDGIICNVSSSSLEEVRSSQLIYGLTKFEVGILAVGSSAGNVLVGVKGTADAVNGDFTTANSVSYRGNGQVRVAGSVVTTLATYGANDVITAYFNGITGKIWFGKNGAPSSGDPAAGTGAHATFTPGNFEACVWCDNAAGDKRMWCRFEADRQVFAAPAGYGLQLGKAYSQEVEGQTRVDSTPVSRRILLVRGDTGERVSQALVQSDPTTGLYSVLVDHPGAIYGLSYDYYGEPWLASAVTTLANRTWPRLSPNGHWYEAEQAGTTGSSEPTWPITGGTVTDGSVIWRDKGLMERPWSEGPYLATPP